VFDEPVQTRSLQHALHACSQASKQTIPPFFFYFNHCKLVRTMQKKFIYTTIKKQNYSNWLSHVTYLFLQFTFYTDTSRPSPKAFFIIYSSRVWLLFHHADPNSGYCKHDTIMKVIKSNFHKKNTKYYPVNSHRCSTLLPAII
jgi:hypothetical protein